MSDFEKDYAGKDVEFLAISAFEDSKRARDFIADSGLKFTWLFASDATLAELGIRSVPSQIVIDREGKVTWVSGITTIPKGVGGIRDALDEALG